MKMITVMPSNSVAIKSSRASLRTAGRNVITEATCAKVHFKLPHKVEYGDTLHLVGSTSVLGDWDAERVVTSSIAPLKWTEGNVWITDLDIPTGEKIEYKYVVFNKARGVQWQSGVNLSLHLPQSAGQAIVMDSWEDGQQSMQMEDHATAMADETKPPVDSSIKSSGLVTAEEIKPDPEILLPVMEMKKEIPVQPQSNIVPGRATKAAPASKRTKKASKTTK